MENQSKVKKILVSVWLAIATALSVIFIIVCIVGGVQNSKKEKQSASACIENDIVAYNINNDINKGIVKPISKNVVFDDVSQEITISLNELSYQFSNLGSYLEEQYNVLNSVMYSTSIIYDSLTFSFDDWASEDDIFYINGDYTIILQLSNNNEFKINHYTEQGNVFIDFEYYLNWDLGSFSSSIYNGIKSAIELDIQANTPSISMNDSIFNTLSSSSVSFISTISSGITAMIGLFYADNSLTAIGFLAVIVVAVSLSYFLFRLIFGLIRMRG